MKMKMHSMVCILISNLNSYVEILTSKVMVFGDSKRGLGDEDRAQMNGVSALSRETPWVCVRWEEEKD